MQRQQNWKNPAGIQLHARHWPVENPKSVIALVHGQGEHSGRYEHLADWFNARQVAVQSFDNQGFGKSGGKRGHAKNLDAYLDDIGILLADVSKNYPGKPAFLYGHSMGGNLVLNYALRRRPEIKGLIATGPWIRLAFEAPGIKIAIGRLLKSIFPSLTLPTGLNAEHISNDPEVVKKYKNDPLVHDKVSAAAGIELLEGAKFLNRFSGKMPVPTLLLHGGDDRLTSAPATRKFSERVSGEVIFREWPGMFHEIHNEPGQEEVFQFVFDWISSF